MYMCYVESNIELVINATKELICTAYHLLIIHGVCS